MSKAENSQDDPELDRILAEILEARDRGETQDREALLAKHPHKAAEIAKFLDEEGEINAADFSGPPGVGNPTPSFHGMHHASSERIGRYELAKKLGTGGQGEVWIAKQHEPVRRKVALKFIQPGRDTKEVVARFKTEFQALAAMDHPNIAKIFDAGTTPSGQPYFVMELVNGATLTQFCDEAKLSVRERLDIFIQIAQGVQHAHFKGIAHRDLKPANVLVTVIDGKPVPKIIDFGLAKAMGGRITDDTLSPQFGVVLGTYEYMAPEQAGYSGQDVDTRADIYSLGVILYELLTGLRPFDSERLRKAALDEMIRIIREEEPIRPSLRLSSSDSAPSTAAVRRAEPRQLSAMLRSELDWIVMKSLEKDRNRRYESASGFAADVQRYLNGEVITAHPPSRTYLLRKYVRKHRGFVASMTAFFSLLVIGIGVSSYLAVIANIARKNEKKSNDKLIEETKRTAEAKLRADQEKHNAELAQAGEAASRYFSHIERAKREIGSKKQGWKKRAELEIAEAEKASKYHATADVELRSLRAAVRMGVDLGEAKFAIAKRGISSIAFHPTRPWVFVSTKRAYLPDQFCHIYVIDRDTGNELFDIKLFEELHPSHNGIRSIAFDATGGKLFVLMELGSILVLPTDSLGSSTAPIARLQEEGFKATSLATIPSSNVLAVLGLRANSEPQIRSYDTETHTLLKSTVAPQAIYVFGCATANNHDAIMVSPTSGKVYAAASRTHETRSMLFEANLLTCYLDCVAYLDHSKLFLAGLINGKTIGEFEEPQNGLPPTGEQGEFKFALDGKYLLLGNYLRKTLDIWATSDQTHQLHCAFKGSDSNAFTFAYSQDGKTMAVSQGDVVTLHDFDDSVVRQIDFAGGRVRGLAIDRDRNFAYSLVDQGDESNRQGWLNQYDLNSEARHIRTYSAPINGMYPGLHVLLEADHGRIVFPQVNSGTNDSITSQFGIEVRVQDRLGSLQRISRSLASTSMVLRPEGELILGGQRTVEAFNAETSAPTRNWSAVLGEVLKPRMGFWTASCIDDLVLLGRRDGVISVFAWNTPPELLGEIECGNAPIEAAAYQPKHHLFVVGDDDGTLHFIDYRKRQTLSQIHSAHDHAITSLA